MKIVPVGNKVVVKRMEADSKTAGGIVLPDSAKEKPQQGRVLSVGEGELKNGNRVPMQVQEGDKVLFASWAGTEVKIGGQDVLILREEDLLAIVN
jgi:chaperonin GroES